MYHKGGKIMKKYKTRNWVKVVLIYILIIIITYLITLRIDQLTSLGY